MFFFTHLEDEFYQKKDLYGDKDLVLAKKAMLELEKFCQSVETLPEHYSQFYLQKMASLINSRLIERK